MLASKDAPESSPRRRPARWSRGRWLVVRAAGHLGDERIAGVQVSLDHLGEGAVRDPRADLDGPWIAEHRKHPHRPLIGLLARPGTRRSAAHAPFAAAPFSAASLAAAAPGPLR